MTLLVRFAPFARWHLVGTAYPDRTCCGLPLAHPARYTGKPRRWLCRYCAGVRTAQQRRDRAYRVGITDSPDE